MIVAAKAQVGDGRTVIVPVPPAVLPFILRCFTLRCFTLRCVILHCPDDDTSVRARPHHVAAP